MVQKKITSAQKMTSVLKVSAKKAAEKKAPAKKVAVTKSTVTNSPAKKSSMKKTTVKAASVKKTTDPVKKTADPVKKTLVPVKKVKVKPVEAKKETLKKVVRKKVSGEQLSAQQAVNNKVTVSKATGQKISAKKLTAEKPTAEKPTAEKHVGKTTTVKNKEQKTVNSSVKKVSPKKGESTALQKPKKASVAGLADSKNGASGSQPKTTKQATKKIAVNTGANNQAETENTNAVAAELLIVHEKEQPITIELPAKEVPLSNSDEVISESTDGNNSEIVHNHESKTSIPFEAINIDEIESVTISAYKYCRLFIEKTPLTFGDKSKETEAYYTTLLKLLVLKEESAGYLSCFDKDYNPLVSEDIILQRRKELFDSMFIGLTMLLYSRPSIIHSRILILMYNIYGSEADFIKFLLWWDLRFFKATEKDLVGKGSLEEEISPAEEILLSIIRIINPGKRQQKKGKEFDGENARWLFPLLLKLTQEKPKKRYFLRALSELGNKMGRNNETIPIVSSWLKRFADDYRSWEIAAEVFANESNKYTVYALCKALSLQSEQDKSMKLMFTLAEALIKRKMYREAFVLILVLALDEKLASEYYKEKLAQWQNSEWFASASEEGGKGNFINEYAICANTLLYLNDKAVFAVITTVSDVNDYAEYTSESMISGSFRYSKIINTLFPGQVVLLRFGWNAVIRKYAVIACEAVKNTGVMDPLFKSVSGVVKPSSDSSKAYVGKAEIAPEIIRKFRIKVGSYISGTAVEFYNRNRKEFIWKFISPDIHFKEKTRNFE